ncbi:hypothetical protein D3C84_1273690 [compost metagenome]
MDEVDLGQQGQDDRQLEADAKGQDQQHGEAEIFADAGQHDDIFGLHAGKEVKGHGQDDEID